VAPLIDPLRPHLEGMVLASIRRLLAATTDAGADAEAIALYDLTARVPLRGLGTWERRIRNELWASQPRPGMLRWLPLKKPPRFVPLLSLCSGSGFEREKALRSLAGGIPNGFFCALAMRRLNDWVPQVRDAAREQIPLIAACSEPDYVVDALWYTLPHWRSWGRLEEADRDALQHVVAIAQVALALKSRLCAATSGPAAVILSQAGPAGSLDRWLDDIARLAIQPSVRATAYRYLLQGRVVWIAGRRWKWIDLQWCRGRFDRILAERQIEVRRPFVELLQEASIDPAVAVRRVAGDLLIERIGSAGPSAPRLAERLASDSSPSVAERGQFALEKIGRSQ
jgi:hypothetical protein